jgi:hypothetical protein
MIGDLELLSGMPIDIGICKVHPLTIGEIAKIGETTYNQYLSILMLDKSSLTPSESLTPQQIEEFNKLDSYSVLLIHAHTDEFMRTLITSSLSLFLKEDVTYHESGFFYLGEIIEGRVIMPENFDQIKLILQKQNFLKEDKTKEFKPADDNTAKIMEKMRKAKEKIQKQKQDEGLGLSDIVSIVSAYSNSIDILNVWNLTVYQLYQSYMRLIMWDEYHNNFLLLPHVSDSSTLKLNHWASKINKQI